MRKGPNRHPGRNFPDTAAAIKTLLTQRKAALVPTAIVMGLVSRASQLGRARHRGAVKSNLQQPRRAPVLLDLGWPASKARSLRSSLGDFFEKVWKKWSEGGGDGKKKKRKRKRGEKERRRGNPFFYSPSFRGEMRHFWVSKYIPEKIKPTLWTLTSPKKIKNRLFLFLIKNH